MSMKHASLLGRGDLNIKNDSIENGYNSKMHVSDF